MAGYIISLNSLDALRLYIENGVYATKLSPPKGFWRVHHEGTFADYATMKPNDNIYFFIDRKIYGIGVLVGVGEDGDCKFNNFLEASAPEEFDYASKEDVLLWNEGDFSVNQRWICTFKPDPHFFTLGIDMDDVLASNPTAFRMLRAFWKLSFIKFDDEENQAFKDVLLKFNQFALANPVEGNSVFRSNYIAVHEAISYKLTINDYALDVKPILSSCANGRFINHEMAIEAGILHQLNQLDSRTNDVFGRWDYLSHQVIASPFKPIDYMDKMDIFGYSYIEGFKPTKSRYLVAELKREPAQPQDIEQVLKYVDWVQEEYAYGDYLMINAVLVASDFSEEVINHKKEVATRKYTIGVRPARSLEWQNLKLVKYLFNSATSKIEFIVIN